MPQFIDLTGKRFGKWTVLSRADNKGTETMWNCVCDCGCSRAVSGNNLRSGCSKSCGCSFLKHGKKGTRLYNIWGGMKARCYRKSHVWYKRYGGRGITVCDEWLNDFQAFHDWAMANGYEDNLTIDRIDNNKGYQPDNCRFVTQAQQVRNRCNSQKAVINGEEKSLYEWAEMYGLSYQTVYRRCERGWRGSDLIKTVNKSANG